MAIHTVHQPQKHHVWDNSIAPVITIKSGDTVHFDCIDASNGSIQPTTIASDLSKCDLSTFDPAQGPVFVEGAEPGDVLQVEILELETADWGWSAVFPGFGVLTDEFDTEAPALKIWKLDREAMCAWFDEEHTIRVPLRPFCGVVGVARGLEGKFSTIPPYNTGGNIDTRHVTAGSTLFLPVEVKGALFSCGDGHAAQGDGEVCGTAIETLMKTKFRLTVRKDRPYTKTPHFRTPPVPGADKEEYYCTTGVEDSFAKATREAVRSMVNFLCAEKNLSRMDAYMICSVACDLRIHEAVDIPNFVVGMMLPLSIFVGQETGL